MSSKGAKASKAVDKGDGHWSGVGKGEKFVVTYTNTDTVGSNTTLPLGKVHPHQHDNINISLRILGDPTSVCPKKNANLLQDCDCKLDNIYIHDYVYIHTYIVRYIALLGGPFQ